jgi:phosphoglycerate dehydrogenase-like enzyme
LGTKVAVLLDPDPVVPAPELDSIAARVDIRMLDSAATAADLDGVEALLLWDHRFGGLAPLLSAPSLRWVHACSIGVDKLVTPELAAGDVTLTNSRGVFDTSIAEWVLAAVLRHVKDLGTTQTLQAERSWRPRVVGRLAGTSAAVLGTGSIGRAVAALLRAVGVHVTIVGRRARPDGPAGPVRASDELESLAHDVDVLVLAAPLTTETRGIVDAAVLGALGPRGLLVNVGRGGLIREDELVAALTSGAVGAAALDVFATEPLPVDSALWAMPQVLVSPHMCGDYTGFERDMVALFGANLDRWMAGEPLVNVVDPIAGYVRG